TVLTSSARVSHRFCCGLSTVASAAGRRAVRFCGQRALRGRANAVCLRHAPFFVWTYGEIVLENIRAEFKERGLDPALAPVLVQAEKPPFLEEGEFGHKTTLQKKGNTVHLTVYMEAQCPDTTGFIRRQLLPAWSRLGATNRVNVSIVPFGKARCAQTEAEEGEDYRCECQHGQNECELNQLMNCAIEFLPDADSYVPLIGCVQGKESVSTAFKSCLAGHSSSDRSLNTRLC
uniref:Gamma-interferon inducible lysosomal thiol reductase n=1 Tax=Globodera pallida TaxID=36090 RepID=A0A183CAJ9_GLOPA